MEDEVELRLEDHPEMHIQVDAEVKRIFEQYYLANLRGHPPFICLESEDLLLMHLYFANFCPAGMPKDNQQYTDLIQLTANSLSGDVVAMLIAVQKDNLELSITSAISW